MAPPPYPPRPRKRSKELRDSRFGSQSGRVLTFFSLVAASWVLFIFTRMAGPELAPAVTNAVGQQLAKVIPQAADAIDRAAAELAPAAAAGAAPVTWNEVPRDDRFYLVFSTDCTGYQNWQSLAIFLSADDVRQPGTLIRIASGCNEVSSALS